jgi:hypothetical protein
MSRLDRIQALQQAVKEYVDAEKTRIDNEVSVLEAILKGRTSGQGIQEINTKIIASVAQSDLSDYLKGG